MAEEQQIRAAAASVRSARQALLAPAVRRAAAVTAALKPADAERAEQDAARVAASAAVYRLTPARLTTPQVPALCEIRPEEGQHLQAGEAIGAADAPPPARTLRRRPPPMG